MSTKLCLQNFVYNFFPSTWLQFLNLFLFPLLKILRKCVNISYHCFLNFHYLYLFFFLLSGLPSLKDFLTLLELYLHSFSVTFRGNLYLLWCYINSKVNVLYLNLPPLAWSSFQILASSILAVFKSKVTSNQKSPRKLDMRSAKQIVF